MIIYGNVRQKIFVKVIYREKKIKYPYSLILFKVNLATYANYTNRFVGVQYSVDMSIIKYATNLAQNLTSSVGLLKKKVFLHIIYNIVALIRFI